MFPTFALSELPNFPPSAMPTVAARPLVRAEAQSCQQDKPTKGTTWRNWRYSALGWIISRMLTIKNEGLTRFNHPDMERWIKPMKKLNTPHWPIDPLTWRPGVTVLGVHYRGTRIQEVLNESNQERIMFRNRPHFFMSRKHRTRQGGSELLKWQTTEWPFGFLTSSTSRSSLVSMFGQAHYWWIECQVKNP